MIIFDQFVFHADFLKVNYLAVGDAVFGQIVRRKLDIDKNL
jgi:hypothetical protein